MTTMTDYRIMLTAGTCITADDIRDGLARGRSLGEIAWSECRDRSDERLHELPGWPACECIGCGCSDPAITTDDGGVPVCAACSEYAVDEDGDVICSQSGRADKLESVTECCGAGGQTRSYMRLRPPVMPEIDSEGGYACYWSTVGDDDRVVSRHTTYELAAQAVAAHDWPSPGDHTQYLCGYEVRRLSDENEWVPVDEG